MDPFSGNNLGGSWNFPSDAPRVDEPDLLPPGDFTQGFEQLSRPSSIDMTNVTTPTSFGETSNVYMGMHLDLHSDFSHLLGGDLVDLYQDPAECFKQPSSPSSNEIIQANTLLPLAQTSPKDYRKRSHSPENFPVKRAKGSRSSRFKTEAARRETRDTREKGACISCQNSKRRCIDGPDPKGPCKRCLERNMKPGISLCFRPKIRDIEVFRRGPTIEFAWSRRWKSKDIKLEAKSIWKPITELPTGRTDGFKVVELSQGHSSEKLRLRVREYNPEPGDKQYYSWYDEDSEHFYNTTPYAITDLGYARNAIKSFLDRNLEGYLDILLLNASPITKRTFETALQNRDLTLLGPALKLWVASRFIETPWHIAGSETLGMSRDTHIKSPYHQRVPQSPIMDFQLDNLVIHSVLQPLLKEILTTLRTKSLAGRLEDWFERQLTYFILLNTIELTMAHDVEFARRYRVRGSRWSNHKLIEMVTHGANTLLTYFHNANKDYFPFSAPWPEVERSHQWSQEQKTYITEIRGLLEQQPEIPIEPAQDMFWTGQLHRAGWTAVSVAV